MLCIYGYGHGHGIDLCFQMTLWPRVGIELPGHLRIFTRLTKSLAQRDKDWLEVLLSPYWDVWQIRIKHFPLGSKHLRLCLKELMGTDLHSSVVLLLHRFISSCILCLGRQFSSFDVSVLNWISYWEMHSGQQIHFISHSLPQQAINLILVLSKVEKMLENAQFVSHSSSEDSDADNWVHLNF